MEYLHLLFSSCTITGGINHELSLEEKVENPPLQCINIQHVSKVRDTDTAWIDTNCLQHHRYSWASYHYNRDLCRFEIFQERHIFVSI